MLALNGHAAAGVVPAGTLAALGPVTSLRRQPPSGQPAAAGLLRQLGRFAPPQDTVLPGRPAAIMISASLTAPGAGAPELSVQLADAAGVGYLIDAGPLPADGRTRQFRVPIGRDADYPLRVRGFSLQYQLPPVRAAAAVLTISSLRTSGQDAGAATASDPLPQPGPALVSEITGQNATNLSGIAVSRGGTTLAVTFPTGSGTVTGLDGVGVTVPATLTVTAGPRLAAVPGIATRAFLADTGHGVGDTIAVPVQGTLIPVKVTGEVARFPTVTGPHGGLIIDQAALQVALMQAGIQPAPVGEWWLRTASPTVAIPGLPAGTAVTSAATVAAGLRAEPLAGAGPEELLAVAVIALLLAGVGFAVGVAAGGERQRDAALFDALGARPGQLAVQFGLEQLMLALPAAATGLLLGTLLSHLIIPAASLTAAATLPDPPVAVQVPLLAAVIIAVIIAAVPPVAATLAGLRRGRTATLRVETEV
ncbi:MAG: FtsX-like permease family protein [Streptosporangiaceae bacterium]